MVQAQVKVMDNLFPGKHLVRSCSLAKQRSKQILLPTQIRYVNRVFTSFLRTFSIVKLRKCYTLHVAVWWVFVRFPNLIYIPNKRTILETQNIIHVNLNCNLLFICRSEKTNTFRYICLNVLESRTQTRTIHFTSRLGGGGNKNELFKYLTGAF